MSFYRTYHRWSTPKHITQEVKARMRDTHTLKLNKVREQRKHSQWRWACNGFWKVSRQIGGLNPGTHTSKGETIYTKVRPQHFPAEWTTGCNLGKLGGMLLPPSTPSWRELQLRFMALLNFIPHPTHPPFHGSMLATLTQLWGVALVPSLGYPYIQFLNKNLTLSMLKSLATTGCS